MEIVMKKNTSPSMKALARAIKEAYLPQGLLSEIRLPYSLK